MTTSIFGTRALLPTASQDSTYSVEIDFDFETWFEDGKFVGAPYYRYVKSLDKDSLISGDRFISSAWYHNGTLRSAQMRNVDVVTLGYNHHSKWSNPQPISSGKVLRNYLAQPRPVDECTRMILVNDFSLLVMEVLGSALDMDPIFFSEHLAWRKDDVNQIFGHRLENHISLCWRRSQSQDLERASVIARKDREGPGYTVIVLFNGGPRDTRSAPLAPERLRLSYSEFSSKSTVTRTRNDPTHGTMGWFLNAVKNSSSLGVSFQPDDLKPQLDALVELALYDWMHYLRSIEIMLNNKSNDIEKYGELSMLSAVTGVRATLCDDADLIHTMLDEIGADGLGKWGPASKAVLRRIGNLKGRADATANEMISSMSLHESMKGIENSTIAIHQAEGVIRLTELAFFFIPLSFTTSFFSMPIKPWSDNYRPTMWFAAAIGLLFVLYGFRYIIHSTQPNGGFYLLYFRLIHFWRSGPGPSQDHV